MLTCETEDDMEFTYEPKEAWDYKHWYNTEFIFSETKCVKVSVFIYTYKKYNGAITDIPVGNLDHQATGRVC